MSGKGNCYDNACAESFFHSLKVELIHGEYFDTREIMRRAVFEYIEVDYNRTRRHSANGHISPLAFETKNGRLTICPLFLGKINMLTSDRFMTAQDAHSKILSALKKRDEEEAAKVMEKHLINAKEYVLARLNDDDDILCKLI